MRSPGCSGILKSRGAIWPTADTCLLHAFSPHSFERSQLRQLQKQPPAKASPATELQTEGLRQSLHRRASIARMPWCGHGHSSTEMSFEHYIGAVSHQAGLAYFQIRP